MGEGGVGEGMEGQRNLCVCMVGRRGDGCTLVVSIGKVMYVL